MDFKAGDDRVTDTDTLNTDVQDDAATRADTPNQETLPQAGRL